MILHRLSKDQRNNKEESIPITINIIAIRYNKESKDLYETRYKKCILLN